MRRQENILPVFLVVCFLCILVLGLSVSGRLNFLTAFLEKGTSAVQAATFRIFQKLPFMSEDEKIKKLQDVNLELLSRITDIKKLERENQALSDQFQTSYPQSYNLLKADVIGASSFIPGVSIPDSFILNKGLKNNLKVGSAVIIKNNLVGVVSRVSANLSEVKLVINPSISFTAKTESGAVGIVRAEEGFAIGNILLSENIKAGELVLTQGDVNDNGIGVPANLVVGKITSVEKNPSDLFQEAKIESFIDFMNLNIVFVYMQDKPIL